jgi:iron-sulfur cluster assembly accessory protein
MNDKPMIQLTDLAADHIASIVAGHKDGIGFRISIKETGCSGYMYVPEIVDQEGEDDIRVDTPQGVVVFIDYRWLSVLQGTTIDLVTEDLGQKRLQFNNPNVDTACGCGESFGIKKDGQ